MNEEQSPDSLLKENHTWIIRSLAILVILGILYSLSSTNTILGKSTKKNTWDGPPLCGNVKNVSLPSANSYIEQTIGGWDCFSGLVDFPANLKGASANVPGETKIYECKDNRLESCFFKFSIPDLNGGYYREVPIFPRTFRMIGKPGTAWFGRESARKKRGKN